MKKLSTLFLVAVAFSLILAACGGADTAVPEPIVKEVIVEKEVIKEVKVEQVVQKEVVKKVEVEKVLIATPTLPPAGEAQFGGSVKIVSQASINSLDPVWTSAYVTIAVAQHMFETPFGWDSSLTAQPRMVESWEVSSDNLKYTFTLRDGLLFHDGRQVTAEDAVASINRWLSWSRGTSSMMKSFAVEDPLAVVDEMTFSLQLKEPYGSVISSFGLPHATPVIMPKDVVGGRIASEVVEEWVGSGVYKFDTWEPGHQVVLDRHASYTPRSEAGDHLVGETVAYIDKLTWLEVPDEETKIAGLETGEWDVVDGAGFDFFKRLKANPDMVIPQYKPGHRSFFILNGSIPPFSDVKARQAVQAAVDIEQVMASLGDRDLWILCPAIYYCGTPLETHVGQEFYNEKNMEKAKQLLADSIYDGSELYMMNPTDYATITPLGFILKPLLEDMGFKVDMPAQDWSSVVANINQAADQWNALTSWGVHWASGEPISDSVIPGTRPWNAKVPILADLRLQYAETVDPVKQKQLVDQIQLEVYKNVPSIYLGQWFSIYPHLKDIKNFEVKAIPWYANAWLNR